jgi:hypothetical protein
LETWATTEVDGEGELDLLALTEAEIGRFDEDAGGAQVHGTTELSAAARDGDVDRGSCPVPRVQAAFHYFRASLLLSLLFVRRRLPLCRRALP